MAGVVGDSSRALPHYFYGDPADVVERMELREMGCRLCVSHDVALGRVVCADSRNESQRGVPGVGYRCKFFKEISQ